MGPSVFVPCSWHVKYFFFTVFPLFNVFSQLDSFFFKLLYHLCLFPSTGNEKKTQSSPSTVISWTCFTSGRATSREEFTQLSFELLHNPSAYLKCLSPSVIYGTLWNGHLRVVPKSDFVLFHIASIKQPVTIYTGLYYLSLSG